MDRIILKVGYGKSPSIQLAINPIFWVYIHFITSEGGTSEELRTDIHLKFSSVVHKVVKNRKNWPKSSLRFSDPHLDKIRSALTVHNDSS